MLSVKAGSNRNLPYVLLGRARAHHSLVARRTHATRAPLVIEQGTNDASLPDQLRSRFATVFAALSDGDAGESDARKLTQLVSESFALDDDGP